MFNTDGTRSDPGVIRQKLFKVFIFLFYLFFKLFYILQQNLKSLLYVHDKCTEQLITKEDDVNQLNTDDQTLAVALRRHDKCVY